MRSLPAPTRVPGAITPSFATDYGELGPQPAISSQAVVKTGRIDQLMRFFLAFHRARAESGEITPKMFAQYRGKIDDFQGFLKIHGKVEIGEVDAGVLDAYRASQLRLTTRDDKHGISPTTAKKRLDAARLFLQWVYERKDDYELPRALNKHFASVRFDPPKPKQFLLEEVRKIFDAATQRTKLYIALALNCGYTQIDIATLDASNVDWHGGVIKRNRNKTRIPQVHKLWPITLELLVRERHEIESGLVLLDQKGQPLKREAIKDNGDLSTQDSIRSAFDRTMTKIGMAKDKRRFKTFRKTSADFIEKHFPEYPHLSSQFLAHAETATKRYYVGRHYELLFEALDKLGEFYGLEV